MFNLSLREIPQILYKYRPFEGGDIATSHGANTLLKFELFASSRENFNDPFDLAMPYRISKENLIEENFVKYYIETYPQTINTPLAINELKNKARNRLKYILDNPEKHWEENQEKIEKLDNNFYGILSLSSTPLEILMWSHYAKNHTGYSLGFNGPKLFKFISNIQKNKGCNFGPVNYKTDYPEYNLFDHHKVKNIIRGFTKHYSWSYEDEYRFLLFDNPNAKLFYPSNIIDEIYLGCKMPSEFVNEILKFVRQNNLKIRIYKMKMSYYKFGLEPFLIYEHY